MGHKTMLLTLMAASLVASQQQLALDVDPNASSTGSNNEENCECVPYYQCDNNTIVTDGIGIIDIRNLAGSCDNYLDLCCQVPDVLPVRAMGNPMRLMERGCGYRNPNGVGFQMIGNTDEAGFAEFPWMVAIIIVNKTTGPTNSDESERYLCGGSLIHPKAVLTAAHCVKGKDVSQLKIRAGEWDTQTKSEPFPHQDREVQTIFAHERYDRGALWNDVAILILKTPVDITEIVNVVCLPQPNEIFDHSRCFASGWGKDKFGKEGVYQVILKKIELPVVPHGVCQTNLRATRLGRYFRLDPSFVCAGGELGKDTCKGDGGSPLVCPLKNDPSRYAQVGTVAWGIGCGEMQVPGVYGNVAYFRTWIDQTMNFNNLNTTSYQP